MRRHLHRSIGLALVVLLSVGLEACTTPQAIDDNTFEIEAIRDAPEGKPASFDFVSASDGVRIEDFKDPLDLPGKTQLSLAHVTIAKTVETATSTSTTDYSITDLHVQEQVGEGWEEFSEFRSMKQYASDIGVVIILDNSKSLRNRLDQERKLAVGLAQTLLDEDDASNQARGAIAVAIVPLAVQAGREITFTKKTQDIELQARDLQPYAYTPLYDVIGQAIRLFDRYERSSPPSRDPFESPFKFEEKFIVVISDGQDDSSRQETPKTIAVQLADKEIDVYVLAVKGSDRVHEQRLQDLARQDWFSDLSTLSAENALERVPTVKDTILQACRDRYNLHYDRSPLSPDFFGKIKFIITAEPKNTTEIDTETGQTR